MKKKMKLQFFAEGDGVMDMAGLDGLLNQATGAQEPTQTTTPPTAELDTTQQTGTETQQQQTQQTQQKQMTPAEYTFAQMRVENTQYKTMLGKLAKATGIEYNNEKELLDKLNDQALTQLSQRQNVPVEVLQRLETLEQTNQAYELEQRKSATMIAFQNLKNTYSLDDQGLLQFAQELDEKGLNPFVKDVDIDGMYRQIHFQDIMNARIEAAVQSALAKSSVADTHSTTPNSAEGKGGSGEQKISTVSELSALLDTAK